MGKIEDDIKNLTTAVNNLTNEINQIKFSILRIHNEISKIEGLPSSGVEGSNQPLTAAVDLGPIEERLDNLQKGLIDRSDIERIEKRLEELASERLQESKETLSRITSLFQSGLELVNLESTLNDIKSLLEETVLQ